LTGLRRVMPSPIVDLNRAVAHAMALGPEAGLALLAGIEAGGGRLAGYAPLAAARGVLCSGPGRWPRRGRPFRRRKVRHGTGGNGSFC
jgi:hypothetical protein